MILNSNYKRGSLALLGCLLVDVSVGEFNLLSFLYKYLASYFRIVYDSNLTEDDMTIIPVIWVSAQIVGSPLGIISFRYLDYKGTFFLFLTGFCAAQFGLSYVTNFYLFAVLYSFVGGVAQGALIILPLYCTWRYFPDSFKPKLSGMILSAYALSPLVTSVLALKIINPNNLKPTIDGNKYFDKTVAMNVPHFLRVFGLICFGMGVVGILMITQPLKNEELEQTQNLNEDELISDEKLSYPGLTQQDNESHLINQISEAQSNNAVIKTQNNDHKEKKKEPEASTSVIQVPNCKENLKLLKDPMFLLTYFCMFLSYLYPLYQGFSWKSKGLDKLQDDDWVTTCGIVGSIFNAASRLFSGLMFQKFGFRAAIGSLLGVIVVSSLTFELSLENKYSFMAAVSLYYWSYGGQLGLYPLLTDQIFRKKGGMAYSFAFSSFSISCVFTLLIHKQITAALGYFGMLITYAVLGVLTFIPMLVLSKRMDQQEKNETKICDLK